MDPFNTQQPQEPQDQAPDAGAGVPDLGGDQGAGGVPPVEPPQPAFGGGEEGGEEPEATPPVVPPAEGEDEAPAVPGEEQQQ